MTDPRPLPIAECRLDLPGLRSQCDRYRAIGRHLERIERRPGRLEARFGAELDAALLREAIGVERECCPFFKIDHDPAGRRLSVTVEDPAQNAALDALEYALTTG